MDLCNHKLSTYQRLFFLIRKTKAPLKKKKICKIAKKKFPLSSSCISRELIRSVSYTISIFSFDWERMKLTP